MEQALSPSGTAHRPDIDFTRELTQAFIDVFKYALPPYLERMGVKASDLAYVGRDTDE